MSIRVLRTLAVVATCAALGAACSSGKSAGTPTSGSSTTIASDPKQTGADEVVIRKLFQDVNNAYKTSVKQGHAVEAAANYDSQTSAEQTAFRKCLDRTSSDVSYNYSVASVRPDPGWVSETKNTVPAGRIYIVPTAVVVTDVPTGTSQPANVTLHATILPDGTAREFIKCG